MDPKQIADSNRVLVDFIREYGALVQAVIRPREQSIETLYHRILGGH